MARIFTLALLRNLRFPVNVTALDLSATSISAAKKAVDESGARTQDVTFTEGNLLSLPFADNSLDLVVTSGALEYVPLNEGMAEIARVIAPGGHMLHLPCRPTPASTFLEILFRFNRIRARKFLRERISQHFRMVHDIASRRCTSLAGARLRCWRKSDSFFTHSRKDESISVQFAQ